MWTNFQPSLIEISKFSLPPPPQIQKRHSKSSGVLSNLNYYLLGTITQLSSVILDAPLKILLQLILPQDKHTSLFPYHDETHQYS